MVRVTVRVTILGSLRIQTSAGDDLTPVGERERTALAVLAITAPMVVSTERLADELYGDDQPTDPRNAVQAVISRLRKALGRSAGLIETLGGAYRLVDIVVDADEVENTLREAKEEGRSKSRRTLLSKALAAWDGPTLDGLTGSDLIDSERFRLEELRAGAEDALFEAQLSEGDHQALIPELQRAVGDEPLRESRWALLMIALYRHDRQAEALRVYQRARDHLTVKLGIEPGPTLRDLEKRILAQDPTLRTASSHPYPASETEGEADDRTPAAATASLPSGLVSVLLCDVEGSVRQWENEPTETAGHIGELHELWAQVATANDGHVIKSTGDGVLAVFATSADALAAATEGQRSQRDLRVRVAVNTGHAAPINRDYRGPLVNRCARLMELAAGGQVLATGPSVELARDRLDTSIRARSLGVHWLRDVSEPIEIFQIDGPGLPTSFPPLRSAGPTSLPRLRAALIGRDDLRREIVEAVGEQPLVTLLGPGGIGKTSLALAAAWEVAGSRSVAFVDLAATHDPNGVAARVADAVSHGDDERTPSQVLADRLMVQTDLIVLDNAEHVLDAVGELLDEVLAHELKGSFLVTSRHPLALAGEVVVAVPPLGLPSEEADLTETAAMPAVDLFLERLAQNSPERSVPDGLLPVVAHICRRLDGIPLAIELAAGRASVLAIEDIAARLDDQLRLLRQVPATRERRHRSLEAVVSWSVEQLPPSARRLFALLSVFAGDVGLDGVEAVADHAGLANLDLIDDIAELSAASLLSVERGSRYRMLEPLRQVAAAELVDVERARWAHARWITDLLADAHRRPGPERAAAFDAADVEGNQIRAALANVAEHRLHDLVVELAIPAGWWFLTRDPMRGAQLFDRIIGGLDPSSQPLQRGLAVLGWGTATAAHPSAGRREGFPEAIVALDREEHPDRGLARIVAGFSMARNTQPSEARLLLAQAERIIPSDDRWASAILDMATMGINASTYHVDSPAPIDQADPVLLGERAAAEFRYLGDTWALGVTLSELGRIKQSVGDLEGAEACLQESLLLLDDREFHGHHYILTELGRMASERGDHDAAAGYHDRALRLAEDDGGAGCMAATVAGMAHAAQWRGESEEAIRMYGDAISLSGDHVKPGVAEAWADEVSRLRESRRPNT